MTDYTIVEYYREHEAYKCGYCKSPDSNYSHGMWGHCLTVEDYENLLNRGWRRSGNYLYKPTNSVTCCPMYTINCHALDFQLSKSQKKVLKKFAAHLGVATTTTTTDSKVVEKKCIEDYFESAPGFKVKTVKLGTEEFTASLELEHELYKKYQIKIHDDTEDECDLRQFKRFLCKTPLSLTANAPKYGSFHHQYFINDKLIAVGVVDVLPSCLSSVYFFYDPELMQLSLGTFGALYEILFVRQMHKEASNFKYYYMGFYIHSCQKMRYKGNFGPSYLLCPENYTWRLLDNDLRKLLDEKRYAKFGEDPPPGEQATTDNNNEDIQQVTVLFKRSVMPYRIYKNLRRTNDDETIQQYVNLVGSSNAKSILLYRE